MINLLIDSFRRRRYKVRFQNERDAASALLILRNSTEQTITWGTDYVSFDSRKTMELIKESGLRFEIVGPKDGPRKKTESVIDHTKAIETSVGLPVLVAAFRPIYKKVHFLNEEAAISGFGVLARSGGGETFGNNVYGVFSERQIELLNNENIPFEVVK